MQARVHCRTCNTLLVLTHKDGRWLLRCPNDGGFVNLMPGEHTLPASYVDDCQQRSASPGAFNLTRTQGDAYEEAAALKRVYLQASIPVAVAHAS